MGKLEQEIVELEDQISLLNQQLSVLKQRHAEERLLPDDDRYKDAEALDAAIERWQEKGWRLADVAQDFKYHSDDAVAILWRPITPCPHALSGIGRSE